MDDLDLDAMAWDATDIQPSAAEAGANSAGEGRAGKQVNLVVTVGVVVGVLALAYVLLPDGASNEPGSSDGEEDAEVSDAADTAVSGESASGFNTIEGSGGLTA